MELQSRSRPNSLKGNVIDSALPYRQAPSSHEEGRLTPDVELQPLQGARTLRRRLWHCSARVCQRCCGRAESGRFPAICRWAGEQRGVGPAEAMGVELARAADRHGGRGHRRDRDRHPGFDRAGQDRGGTQLQRGCHRRLGKAWGIQSAADGRRHGSCSKQGDPCHIPQWA